MNKRQSSNRTKVDTQRVWTSFKGRTEGISKVEWRAKSRCRRLKRCKMNVDCAKDTE